MQTIKDMRLSLGMTQVEFAAALGIPRRSVQNWEKKVSTPPAYVVELIQYRIAHDTSLREAQKENS